MTVSIRKQKRATLARMIGRPPIWCRRYAIRYLKPVPVQVEISVHVVGVTQWPPLCLRHELVEVLNGELVLACDRVTFV